MSENEINKAVENAASSVSMEGFVVDEETKELCRRSLRGEITHEEFIKEALIKAGVKV